MQITPDEAWQLAKALTDELWRVGADPGREVCRIQFRGSTASGREIGMGGMGRWPMENFLATRIQEYAKRKG